MEWADDNELPQLDPEAAMLFRLMTAQIIRISSANSANGAKGGRGKKSEESEAKPRKPSVTNTVPVSVTDTDTVTDPISISPPNPLTGEAAAPQRESRKRFVPPSVDEVMAYCAERDNGINAQAFIDYYAASGWKRGKTPISDWRACVRTWEQNRKTDHKGAVAPDPAAYSDWGDV